MSCGKRSTIVCGNDFTLSLSKDGNVYSFGYSECRAHGHEEELVFPPKIIPNLTNIRSISVGSNPSEIHCACLDNDGNVYTFGDNFSSQLGNGSTMEFTHIPQKINLPACKQVACGDNFTLCLTEDGELYSFGNNNYGQLGLGDDIRRCNTPNKIESVKDVEFIECGNYSAFCKTKNNEVYSWGHNWFGQLGLGTRDDKKIPTLCSTLSTENIIDIKCGTNHTIVLTSNNDILSCGNHYLGQLGRDVEDDECSPLFQKIPNLPKIKRISGGYNHSFCIDENNDLYVFGYNNAGQLGLKNFSHKYNPVKHPKLSNIIDISNGGNITFVKTSSNEMYAFGNNRHSQFGIKTNSGEQCKPIKVFQDNEDIWYSNP